MRTFLIPYLNILVGQYLTLHESTPFPRGNEGQGAVVNTMG